MSLYPHLLRERLIGGLPITPSLITYYDGIDNFATIDNSNAVGNPYDFERTNAFSLAIAFSCSIDTFPSSSQDLISKSSSTAGYFMNLSNGLGVNFIFLEGGVFKVMSTASGFGISANSESIVIATYDGSSNLNTGTVVHIYTGAGLLSQRCTVAGGTLSNSGGSTLAGTIRNTTNAWFARNPVVTTRYFIGTHRHPSIWNIALSNTQCDDLVNRMISNTVTGHANYANCVGYWRDVIGNVKILNNKNETYNATLNNF